MTSLLRKLVARGDRVAIIDGHLSIEAKSGKDIPTDWLGRHSCELVAEISAATATSMFKFVEHTTGNYSGKDGVTLQFVDISTGASGFIVFNADIRRARNTKAGKKGEKRPPGQFAVGPRSSFMKFWLRSGLTVPRRRNSELHEYMGKLKRIYFVASFQRGEKLDKDSVQPAQISASAVRSALNLPTTLPTNRRQRTDSEPTRSTDNDSRQAPATRRGRPFQSTGQTKHGTRSSGIEVSPPPPTVPSAEVEEWLKGFE